MKDNKKRRVKDNMINCLTNLRKIHTVYLQIRTQQLDNFISIMNLKQTRMYETFTKYYISTNKYNSSSITIKIMWVHQ